MEKVSREKHGKQNENGKFHQLQDWKVGERCILKVGEKHQRNSTQSFLSNLLLLLHQLASHFFSVNEDLLRSLGNQLLSTGWGRFLAAHVHLLHKALLARLRCSPNSPAFSWQKRVRGTARLHPSTGLGWSPPIDLPSLALLLIKQDPFIVRAKEDRAPPIELVLRLASVFAAASWSPVGNISCKLTCS